LTPQLAQKELSGGFKASEVRPEAVPSPLADTAVQTFFEVV
jgi:hypothetical protein